MYCVCDVTSLLSPAGADNADNQSFISKWVPFGDVCRMFLKELHVQTLVALVLLSLVGIVAGVNRPSRTCSNHTRQPTQNL